MGLSPIFTPQQKNETGSSPGCDRPSQGSAHKLLFFAKRIFGCSRLSRSKLRSALAGTKIVAEKKEEFCRRFMHPCQS